MKINVAWSTDENARIAGKSCSKKAVLDLVEKKLAILYSSVKYNTENLLEGVKSVLGTAPIIGTTSNKGIITQDGYITSQAGFLGMLAIGDNDTAVGTAICKKQVTARETGKMVANRAKQKVGTNCSPAYFIMFATPGDEEEYLKGIQDVIGEVPCFGGTAADDDLSGKWKIYTEDGIVNDGVAVAFVYTNKKIENILDGKYHETVNSGVITKLTGKRELDEIDGIQALKRYGEWTNKKVRELRGLKLFNQSILKPLGVKTHNGTMTVIRHPLNGNTDYSMNIGNDLAVNTAVIQMQISKEELVNSPTYILRDLKKKIKDNSVGYIIIHDGSRKNVVEEDIHEMAKKIKKEAGETPFLMSFNYGEYGRGEHTENVCGGLMISVTGFLY